MRNIGTPKKKKGGGQKPSAIFGYRIWSLLRFVCNNLSEREWGGSAPSKSATDDNKQNYPCVK